MKIKVRANRKTVVRFAPIGITCLDWQVDDLMAVKINHQPFNLPPLCKSAQFVCWRSALDSLIENQAVR